MMYIEHTNLEDNLHQILTNRIPTSSSPSASEATAAVAASALLARVREAHNSASSTLHQTQRHTTTSAADDHFQQQNNLNNSSTPNNYKTAAKEWIKRPEPNLLPLKPKNSFNLSDKLSVLVTSNNIAASPTPQHKEQAQEELPRQYQQQGEEEEQYELLQVIDSDQTAQAETSNILQTAKNVQQDELGSFASTSHFVIDLKDGQKIASSNASAVPTQQQLQVDEDEEFEYIVTRVPKKKLQKTDTATSQTIPDKNLLNRKVVRPVPEAIPIDLHPGAQLHNGYQAPIEPPPLLAARPLRRSIPNLLKYTIDSEDYSNNHRELNGHVNAALYVEDVNDCDYYSDSETVETASPGRAAYAYKKALYRRQKDQMGLDIINKLKQLFSWNQSNQTNQYDTAHQEGKRKRRSEDWSAGNKVGPQQIKYRKVENRFPKYIAAGSEEDDLIDFLPPLSSSNQQQYRKSEKYDKQYLLNSSALSSRALLEMSNRRSNSLDKPPLRKSIFSTPHITQQLIKNTTYADIEFSDDDEPVLVKGFNIKPPALAAVNRVPEVYNIPIVRTDDQRIKSMHHKPPPPPLIEPSTGNILQLSLNPQLENRRTYAETLRQGTGSGYVLGGRSSSSTSESSRMFNGLIGQRTSSWSTQNRSSILNQERQSEDREKYQQLLEQVVPRLYGLSRRENKFSSSSLNSSVQRRRSGVPLNTAITASARTSPTSNRRSMGLGQSFLKRPPLSSTINLDDDDDDDDDGDVTITGISHLKSLRASKPKQSIPTTVVIDDDDELSDIQDLVNEERHMLAACAKIQKEEKSFNNLREPKAENTKKDILPFVEPVNSLQDRFNASPLIKENWLEKLQSRWSQRKKNRHEEVKETVKVTEKLTAERRAAEAEIQERLRKFQIVDPELLIVDDFEDVIEEPEFVELTPQHRARINAAICGPLDQILISKFNLNITRRDIHTLCGHNWLNDEVINFYMNLLTERGEKRHESDGLPTVYAMNTFFVPRLMQAGHAGVKRWTRKVDIFAKDIMPVPVHVGGVHWCMAIIHIKNRTIKYYDSMGTPNPSVLKALEQYLKDESMDKRRQTFDTSDFVIESVQGVPRQMNGSDCGVFSCMFAEYITRNREITFSQQNMEYFRQKMVLEIVMGELLQ